MQGIRTDETQYVLAQKSTSKCVCTSRLVLRLMSTRSPRTTKLDVKLKDKGASKHTRTSCPCKSHFVPKKIVFFWSLVTAQLVSALRSQHCSGLALIPCCLRSLVCSSHARCDGEQSRQAECVFAADHFAASFHLRYTRHGLVDWPNTLLTSYEPNKNSRNSVVRLLNYGRATQSNPSRRSRNSSRHNTTHSGNALQHLSVTWPYGHEWRGHDPMKRNLFNCRSLLCWQVGVGGTVENSAPRHK